MPMYGCTEGRYNQCFHRMDTKPETKEQINIQRANSMREIQKESREVLKHLISSSMVPSIIISTQLQYTAALSSSCFTSAQSHNMGESIPGSSGSSGSSPPNESICQDLNPVHSALFSSVKW